MSEHPILIFDGLRYHCTACGNNQIVACDHWQAVFNRVCSAKEMNGVNGFRWKDIATADLAREKEQKGLAPGGALTQEMLRASYDAALNAMAWIDKRVQEELIKP